MKFLAGFLALISSFFAGNSPSNSQPAPPLNTAIITFNETYFAPVVAEPGNFPWAKKIAAGSGESVKSLSVTPPIPIPTPPPPPPAPIPILPPIPISDSYLENPEPIVNWYMPVTLQGNSNETNALPEMTFDREFWRIEVIAYWAPKDLSHPPVEKDYFKLEVYDKKTNKLIYTMTSGTEETIHKFQAFKKPGTYYFKTYLKNPSQFEITFTFH